MPLEHELALLKAEEFAAKGKQVSYKLSWYIAQADSLNRLIWLMMKANRSREEIITFLDVSNGFWEISMKVHGGGGTEASMVEVLEQLAEVRAKKFKNPELRKDEELFEKDSHLRLTEKATAIEIFLTESQYSPERIAELVGISVSRVSEIKEILNARSSGNGS